MYYYVEMNYSVLKFWRLIKNKILLNLSTLYSWGTPEWVLKLTIIRLLSLCSIVPLRFAVTCLSFEIILNFNIIKYPGFVSEGNKIRILDHKSYIFSNVISDGHVSHVSVLPAFPFSKPDKLGRWIMWVPGMRLRKVIVVHVNRAVRNLVRVFLEKYPTMGVGSSGLWFFFSFFN